MWQSRRWPAWGWWPLSRLYGALVGLQHLAYATGLRQATRLPCPVLVIGNVIAGGAGKTPTTMALVQHLQAQGVRVGVISRGHGRASAACLAVTSASSATDVGDEPLLIHLRTQVPVFVAKQRAQAGLALLQAHPDTQLLVCDDGLQHLALAADLTLCVFDERGVGNGWLLPAGPLREPWPKAVDWCLQIGVADQARAHQIAAAFQAKRQLANCAVDAHGRRVPLADLRNRAVVAFAGIAKPEVFFADLRAQGVVPNREIALGDHGSAADHAWLHAALARSQGHHQALSDPSATSALAHDVTGSEAPVLLCTEKDAVKLWPSHPHVLAVPLQLALPIELLDAMSSRIQLLIRR